jgi:hypothetical protein
VVGFASIDPPAFLTPKFTDQSQRSNAPLGLESMTNFIRFSFLKPWINAHKGSSPYTIYHHVLGPRFQNIEMPDMVARHFPSMKDKAR